MAVTKPIVSALVMLALIAAGDTASGGSPPRSRIAFETPVTLESFSPTRTALAGERAGEPVVEVDRSGHVYVAATALLATASPVWFSDDGQTFRELQSPGRVREWGLGAEGDLAIDPRGRAYFVDTYGFSMLLTRWSASRDWEFTRPVVGVPAGLNDRPWLQWTRAGLYLYVNHSEYVAVYRSRDEGLTWQSLGPLSFRGNSVQQYFPGHMSADRSGRTLVVAGLVYERSGNGRALLAANVSRDGGRTWETTIFDRFRADHRFSPYFPGISEVDGRGRIYVTWATDRGGGCDVYVAMLGRRTRAFTDPLRVSNGHGCARMPWLDANERGEIAVAWYQTAGPRDSVTSGTPFLYGWALPGQGFEQVAHRGDWYVEVAMISGLATGDRRILRGRVPSDGPVLVGAEEGQLLEFLQVDIGGDGRVHVAFSVYPGDSPYLGQFDVADANYVVTKTTFRDLQQQ